MNRMAGVIAGVLVSSACGAPPSSVPVAPALTRLQLTRAGELSGPGATSQVKAEALYSNGTRRDVTAATRWSVIPSTVASVDASGMLTALALGLASVNATYGEAGQSRFGSLSVVVTPPGTFVLAGRVREPAAGPLEGVTVLHLASGTSVTTGRDGGFSLPGMTSRRLSLQKPGYESVELDASPNFAIDPPLQRIARLTTGSSTALTLAPNDMEYVDTAAGVVCQPCRLIRIPIPAAGKLRITVQWDDADAAVNLWTGGQVFTGRDVAREVSADLTVVPGELIVYVGRRLGSVELSGHASMTMLVSDVSEMAVAARISRMFVREAVCDRY